MSICGRLMEAAASPVAIGSASIIDVRPWMISSYGTHLARPTISPSFNNTNYNPTRAEKEGQTRETPTSTIIVLQAHLGR